MTVDDDLATLREAIEQSAIPMIGSEALARVEAEIARLQKYETAVLEFRSKVDEARALLGDGREPDGYRLDGGRMIPTDR